MKTANENRHDNLLSLIDIHGSIQNLADRLGKSHAQISQLKTKAKDSKTKRPRNMSDRMAREIEQSLGLDHGWMDRSWVVPDSSEARSLPVSAPNTVLAHVLTPDEERVLALYRTVPQDFRANALDLLRIFCRVSQSKMPSKT